MSGNMVFPLSAQMWALGFISGGSRSPSGPLILAGSKRRLHGLGRRRLDGSTPEKREDQDHYRSERRPHVWPNRASIRAHELANSSTKVSRSFWDAKWRLMAQARQMATSDF